jgi:hypothetical protein
MILDMLYKNLNFLYGKFVILLNFEYLKLIKQQLLLYNIYNKAF